MSFDKKYIDFWRKQPGFISVLDCYVDYISSCSICDCDHGCRDTIANHGAKLCALILALKDGTKPETMELLVEKDEKAFIQELHEEIYRKARADRDSKD